MLIVTKPEPLLPWVTGVACLLLALQVPAGEREPSPSKRMILGYVERVWFKAGEISVKAKLDTGAKTSSLDARNIEFFERKGRKWVRFDLATRESDRPFHRMERPLKRHVRIKRHKTDNQRRAVVDMKFCVGGRPLRGEFSLINRERFIYPVLLGRQVLKKIALVDAGAAFLGGRDCAPEGAA